MKYSDLLAVKEKVDRAKNNITGLEGQKTALEKTLIKEWGSKTVEEASTKLKKMKKEVEALTDQFNEGLETLEEKLNQ